MKEYNGIGRKDEIHGADEFWHYPGMMEVSAYCSRFERRYDFDAFSMSDYQSCENCRHLGPDDRCILNK